MKENERILKLYDKGHSKEAIAKFMGKGIDAIESYLTRRLKKYTMDKHSRLTRYARHKGYESVGHLFTQEGYHATHDFHKEFLNKIK